MANAQASFHALLAICLFRSLEKCLIQIFSTLLTVLSFLLLSTDTFYNFKNTQQKNRLLSLTIITPL